MRAALAFSLILFTCGQSNVMAQVTAKAPPPPVATPVPKKAEPKKDEAEPFDQKKEDEEMLKTAGVSLDGNGLQDWFKRHTVTEADRAKIDKLIKQCGDDDFDLREAASAELLGYGVGALGIIEQHIKADRDPEVVLRCERAQKRIEKVPTRSVSCAAARMLAIGKPVGAAETLLAYLPLAGDDGVVDEVRTALTSLAIRNGKLEQALLDALDGKEPIKRAAVAEALSRCTDKLAQEKMHTFLSSAKLEDPELKMNVTIGLIVTGHDKKLVKDLIKLTAEIPYGKGYRAEDLLFRIAGENPPTATFSGDEAARKLSQKEWLAWWEKNEIKADLTKLEEAEKLLGFTLIIEMDQFQGGGRIVEVGADGKQRWDMKGLAYPVDAISMPGNRVIVAELNTNRVGEREIATGKELWGVNLNQPINLQRLANGHIVATGRSQVIEIDRNHKIVTTINRGGDIVAGVKLRNGNFLVVTNGGALITHDKDGKVIKTVAGPRPNYNSTVQQLPSGKLLLTEPRSVVVVDPESGKVETQVININNPTSAQKLPNGNLLVASQSNFAQPVYEVNPKGETVWKYTSTDPTGQFRAWKGRRH